MHSIVSCAPPSSGCVALQHEVPAQPAAHAHRRREAHPVQAVVDAHARVVDLEAPTPPSAAAGSASGSRAPRWRRRARPPARAGSTWIHWWSPVASANWSMRRCSTVIQSLTPRSSGRPGGCRSARCAKVFIGRSRSEGQASQACSGRPLCQVALDAARRHVPQRQAARGQLHVVLRVAQRGHHRQRQRGQVLLQLVERRACGRARASPPGRASDVRRRACAPAAPARRRAWPGCRTGWAAAGSAPGRRCAAPRPAACRAGRRACPAPHGWCPWAAAARCRRVDVPAADRRQVRPAAAPATGAPTAGGRRRPASPHGPAAARQPATLVASVLLPTPPLGLATTITGMRDPPLRAGVAALW